MRHLTANACIITNRVGPIKLKFPGKETHVAGVVDEPREVAALGGVDDVVLVYAEEVGRSDALLLVPLFPDVGDEWPEKQQGQAISLVS